MGDGAFAMTDEALFYRRFVSDVRRCAAGRAPAAVAEIERRVRVALIAEPSARERRWGRVVAAVRELLATIAPGDVPARERLLAFVRENADLGRPRDLAITDLRLEARAERVLTTASGRSYLVLTAAPVAARRPLRGLEEVVPTATRRLAAAAVYGLCLGATLAALWFAFVVPV